MIAVLIGAWVGGRLLAWESPLIEKPPQALSGPADEVALSAIEPSASRRRPTGAMSYADPSRDPLFAAGIESVPGSGTGLGPWIVPGAPPIVRYVMVPALPPGWAYAGSARTAAEQDPAVYRAKARASSEQAIPAQRTDASFAHDYGTWRNFGRITGEELAMARAQDPVGAPGAVPFGGPAAKVRRSSRNRWSLDSWAFVRQGSDAAPISQGRVPIYGASQVGTIAQWRAAPSSRFDPRLYARAYQALVAGGETEFATGASVRPVPALPLRAAGEVRLAVTPFATDIRPAGYVFTELAPFPLVEQVTGELFAGGGYVGGAADTGFVDGQFTLTRPLIDYNPDAKRQVRLSVGGGAWGGAQEGASRLDIGPTMRLDMLFGKVPARVSLDWRERVTGDAAPESGVAATVSASF
jgi:hypothetical protein